VAKIVSYKLIPIYSYLKTKIKYNDSMIIKYRKKEKNKERGNFQKQKTNKVNLGYI